MSADPGGVFASDDHRRVLGHLRAPHEDDGRLPVDHLHERLAVDARVNRANVEEILSDLEADGLAEREDGHLRMTEKGFGLLTGPNLPEPPPLPEAQVLALREAGVIDDEAVDAWRAAVEGGEPE